MRKLWRERGSSRGRANDLAEKSESQSSRCNGLTPSLVFKFDRSGGILLPPGYAFGFHEITSLR
ncbi:hypothetical protein GKZ68_09880 [Hymenobacter sp. BRD128]|uniref:hypothetical protein n=1 Tax=Hymenobacter sp. BRD128 TaxID=2675878 RepID=UPI001563E6E3|nr:hypothetical protein [Hymenobacter sp. BRD128]QKG56908.1 hypothetical protein GKZ68_09880 [Hymenobacter sp. BRD128]